MLARIFSLFAVLTFLFLNLSVAQSQDLLSRIFVRKAKAVSESEKKSLQILDGALGRLRKVYSPKETSLYQSYEEWKDTYNRYASQTEESRRLIEKMLEIAEELFKEWKEEAESMSDRKLKRRSLTKLDDTMDRFDDIKEKLLERRDSEMTVLTQLRDRVLFVKHNLNAESLNVLAEESDSIQEEIKELIDAVEESVAKLDSFIVTLS